MIILKGEPKSNQHIYKISARGGFAKIYMSAEGKAIKTDYAWQAKNQWKKPLLTGDVTVTATFFHKTKRKCDIDNFNKLFLDSLTGIVWEDDSQITEMMLKKSYDPKNPRIELFIV